MDLRIWLALVLACFVFSVSPGPAVMSCMSYTISKGTRAAVFNVFGLQTANLLQLIVVSLGLGAIVATSPKLFSVLQPCVPVDEAGILRPLRVTEHLADGLELLLLVRRDVEQPLAGAERARRARGDVVVAQRLRFPTGDQVVGHRPAHGGHHRLLGCSAPRKSRGNFRARKMDGRRSSPLEATGSSNAQLHRKNRNPTCD